MRTGENQETHNATNLSPLHTVLNVLQCVKFGDAVLNIAYVSLLSSICLDLTWSYCRYYSKYIDSIGGGLGNSFITP